MKAIRFLRTFRAGLLGASLGAFGIVSVSDAATQGTLGNTSTGTVTINASIAAKVQITNLADVTFVDADLAPVIGTAGQATKPQNVCVWSNNPTRNYFITATGSGTGGAFTLANSTNPVIPYEVSWNATSGQTTGTSLASGTKSAAFISTATTPTCGGGTTASLIIGILGTDATAMLAATTYTGVLTLLVSPS